MPGEEIKIVISKDGEVQIEASNVKGSSCKQLTNDLEKALGRTVSDKTKGEFYERENKLNEKQTQGY